MPNAKASLKIFQQILIDEFTRELQLFIDASSGRGDFHADFTDKLLGLIVDPLLSLIDNVPVPGTSLFQGGASFLIDWLNDKRKESIHDQGEQLAWDSEPDKLRILLENMAMEVTCRYQYWITECLVEEPIEGIIPFAKTGVGRMLEYVVRNKLPLTQQTLLKGIHEGQSGAGTSGFRDTTLKVVDEPSHSFQAKAKQWLIGNKHTAEGAYKRPGLQTFDNRLWVLRDKKKSAEQNYQKQNKSRTKSQKRESIIIFDGSSTKFSDKEDPKYSHIVVSTMFKNSRYGHLEEKETLQSPNKLTAIYQQKLARYKPIWIAITHKEFINYLQQAQKKNGELCLLTFCRGLSATRSNVERVFYYADESFEELNLSNINIEGLDLSHAVFNNCKFGGSLRNTKWNHSYLREADFSQVTTAEGADFSNAHLEGLKAPNINFSNCDFTQTQLQYADLSGAKLINTKSLGAVWSHAILLDTETSDWSSLRQTQVEQQLLALQQADALRAINVAYNQQQQQIIMLQNDLKQLETKSPNKCAELPATAPHEPPAKLHKLDKFTATLLHEQQARLSLERHCQMELRRLAYSAEQSQHSTEQHAEQIIQLQSNLSKLESEQQGFTQLINDTHNLTEQISRHDIKIGAIEKQLEKLESRFEHRLANLEEEVGILDTKIDDVRKMIKIETLTDLIEQLNQADERYFIDIDLAQSTHFYIPLTAQPTMQDCSVAEDLMNTIDRFIFAPEKSKERVCLLLGDAGSGKTIFGLMLQQRLWERNTSSLNTDKRIIPLRIAMKRFNIEGAQDCINTILKKDYNFTESAIRTLKTSTAQFVFIFDGFDEIAGGGIVNPYQANQLGQWGVNPKVIISCRSEYLRDQPYKALLGPGGENNDALISELHLLPFNTNQIRDYFTKRAEQNGLEGRTQAEYEEFLTKTTGLIDLINTPFLLKIYISAYPILIKHTTKIARCDLYDAFTHAWFQKEEQTLMDQLSATHGNITGDTKHSFLQFSRRLAFAMFEERVNKVSYIKPSENPWEIESFEEDSTHASKNINAQKWELYFSDKTDATIQTRRGCPLRCSNGTSYSFIHQSFLEYFTADALWDALINQTNETQRLAKWGARCLTQAPKIPAVVQFIADRLRSHPQRKLAEANLYTLIAASKKSITISLSEAQKDNTIRAASNAMTVLNFALIPFTFKAFDDKSNTFFQEIQIHDADLTSAELSGINFTGADLKNVDLTGAKLSHATLDYCNLTGINVKQLPMLPEENPIQCVAYSFNGQWIVSANKNVIRLYRRSEFHWKLATILVAHEEDITSLAFSPRNNQCVSGSRDNSIKLWDINVTAEEISLTPGPVFQGHEDWVTSVAYSNDGNQIASGAKDKTARLWTIKDRSMIVFEGHTEKVTSVAFSPKSNQLISGSTDKTLRVWRIDGSTELVLLGHTSHVTCVTFSPDGNLIASASLDKTIRLWASSNGAQKFVFKGHTEAINSLIFTPNGYQIASASDDNTIRLWGTNGTSGPSFEGHTGAVTGIACSPDGGQLISASTDTTLRIWNIHSALPPPQEGHTQSVSNLAISRTGDQFASASADCSVRLWSIDGTPIREFEGHENEVLGIAFSEHNHIVSSSKDHVIRFWDTNGTAGPIIKQNSSVHRLALSANGDQFILSSDDTPSAIWDIDHSISIDATNPNRPISEAQLKIKMQLQTAGTAEKITCVAFSPNRTQLALGTSNNIIQLLNHEKNNAHSLAQHTQPISCLAFSADGLQLASGSHDNTIRLWQTSDGSLVRVFRGHTNVVLTVAISPNGHVIASGGLDNTIRLRDVEGKPGQILQGHKAGVSSLVFSSNNQLISASLDRTVRIWRCNEYGIWIQMCQHPRDTTFRATDCSMRSVIGLSPLDQEYFRQSDVSCCTVQYTGDTPHEMHIVSPTTPKLNSLNTSRPISHLIPERARTPSSYTLSNTQSNITFFNPQTSKMNSYQLSDIEAHAAEETSTDEPDKPNTKSKTKNTCCNIM